MSNFGMAISGAGIESLFGIRNFGNRVFLEFGISGIKSFWNSEFLKSSLFGFRNFGNQVFLEFGISGIGDGSFRNEDGSFRNRGWIFQEWGMDLSGIEDGSFRNGGWIFQE